MRRIKVYDKGSNELVYGNEGDTSLYDKFDKDLIKYNDSNKYVIIDEDISNEVATKMVMELRKKEYLPIEEQMDMRYHDKLNGTNLWEEHITAVKQKYPKPMV